jgi:hypothetical protein
MRRGAAGRGELESAELGALLAEITKGPLTAQGGEPLAHELAHLAKEGTAPRVLDRWQLKLLPELRMVLLAAIHRNPAKIAKTKSGRQVKKRLGHGHKAEAAAHTATESGGRRGRMESTAGGSAPPGSDPDIRGKR